MTINLPFHKRSHFIEKPVEIILDMATIEATCEKLEIEFWQIKEYATKHDVEFATELLYQGYMRACEKGFNWPVISFIKFKITKKRPVPEYSRLHAATWSMYMSREARGFFAQCMTELFGKIVKAYKPAGKKKVTSKQHSMNSGNLQSEN